MTSEQRKSSKRLVAVLLLTRSRSGPRLAFCYPPNPQLGASIIADDDNGSDSDADSDSNEGPLNLPSPLQAATATLQKANTNRVNRIGHDSHSFYIRDGVLAFSEDSLEKLLSPGCWSDRKEVRSMSRWSHLCRPSNVRRSRWQLGSQTHTHVSNGAKREGSPVTPSKTARPSVEDKDDNLQAQVGITITEPKTPSKPVQDFTHVPESFESHGQLSLATSMNSESTASATVPEHLTSVQRSIRFERGPQQRTPAKCW